MSYCRFCECDVYVYDDIRGGITIMTFTEGDFNEKTRSDAIKRLETLRADGLDIPEGVFERMKTDLEEIGETAGLEPDELYLNEPEMFARKE